MTNKHHISGYSLVETLLAAAIAAIILYATTSFFIEVLLSKNNYIVNQELNYNMQFIVQTLGKEIKDATSVDTFQSVLGSNPGVLHLTKNEFAENPTIVSVNSGRLQVQKAGGSAENISSNKVNVSNFIINYDEPLNSTGIVTGSITLQSTVNTTKFLNENFSFSLRIKN